MKKYSFEDRLKYVLQSGLPSWATWEDGTSRYAYGVLDSKRSKLEAIDSAIEWSDKYDKRWRERAEREVPSSASEEAA